MTDPQIRELAIQRINDPKQGDLISLLPEDYLDDVLRLEFLTIATFGVKETREFDAELKVLTARLKAAAIEQHEINIIVEVIDAKNSN